MTMAIEVNCETGQIIEREMTAEELTQRKADQEDQALFLQQQAEAKATKAAAQAKLAALGLTTDDLKALGL